MVPSSGTDGSPLVAMILHSAVMLLSAKTVKDTHKLTSEDFQRTKEDTSRLQWPLENRQIVSEELAIYPQFIRLNAVKKLRGS